MSESLETSARNSAACATLVAHALGDGFGRLLVVVPGDGDVGALACQRERDGRTNALLRACHQRDLALQRHAVSPLRGLSLCAAPATPQFPRHHLLGARLSRAALLGIATSHERLWRAALPARSDDASRLQIGDLLLTVAELGQSGFVVVAELRRDAGLRRRLGEPPRRAVHLQLSVLGMIDVGDMAVGDHVGIVRRLEHGVDRRRDDVGAAQPGDPVVARAGVMGRQKVYYGNVWTELNTVGSDLFSLLNARLTKYTRLLQAYTQLGWAKALQQDDLPGSADVSAPNACRPTGATCRSSPAPSPERT